MAKTTTEQEMKDMELHDEIKSDAYIILRVIGGWIYWQICDRGEGIHSSYAVAGVFVPEK